MKLISRVLRNLWILLALAVVAVPVTARPTARSLPGLVWHDAMEKVVLFGGETRTDASSLRYYLNDTWEWDGKLWVQRYPLNPPPGRAGQATAYDVVSKRLIVFGGKYGLDPKDRDITLLRGDTWELVGSTWRPIGSATNPEPRQQPGAAFDIANNRMVMYGGFNTANGFIHDTWVLQGSSWRQIPTTIQVNNPTMVYDRARQQTLLLGADAEGKTLMYEFVGETWRQLTPENLPACVRFSAMTYEQRFTRVVFQGGACFTGASVAETWLWHGDDWVMIEPSPTPGFVTGFGLANDPIRHETVLFGGIDFLERSFTYIFRNNQWAFNIENQVPGGRSLFAFAADPEREVTWLYGGLDDIGDLLNDLFMLRGGVWSRQITTGGPPFCFSPLGTFDKERKRFVLMCDNADIWEWDGESWYDFSQTKVPEQPDDRRFASLVYDERLKKTVLFGGFDEFNYLSDVWLWDGAKWTELKIKTKEAPPGRGLTAMFYDPSTQRTVIFGGIGRPTIDDAIRRYEDMWSFDGTKWTQLKPSTLPGPRYGSQVGLDPATNRIVLFGGKNGQEIYINEQWEWSGSVWTKVTPENPPSARMNGRMAIDPITGKLMLYGGYAGYYFSELWTIENGKWTIQPYRSSRDARPVRRSSTPAPDSESEPLGDW